ncbi:unnamed protein product [Vitrella brassicaformis CCMP3155]|uniref:Ubiquinone biosynthesis protein COQ4 homolog, mitochondrial n=1 Tax=Vitrella brassicaformis (strain CCMP3155) TaxID=1169540 RepID=A0A0G4EG38_VITBC|nr:unnamed protein product [Vitrella brassicaformis CCMP3155]|mmetsp:Transcript_24564/g.60710  ORF Transcript_24564/g.60710 Transcript_24564/m.60710 type:complete len:322 (-) Transcript_24564:44-1009(-)|eukprot:CEL94406.1 unnamed protein product [Vitrella brassicaformis CCMP3155]
MLRQTLACRSAREFTSLFSHHHIETTVFDKLSLAVSSALGAFNDPMRADLVACLGEVTGREALIAMHKQMSADSEGRRVLDDRPLIREEEIRLDRLRELPRGTLGREYVRFLDTFGYHPHERDPVKYVDDENLAYVMTRYRQLHDFAHVAFSLNTSVECEVALKAIEMTQTKLPMTVLSTFVGAFTAPVVRQEPIDSSTNAPQGETTAAGPSSRGQPSEPSQPSTSPASTTSSSSSEAASSPLEVPLRPAEGLKYQKREVFYPRRILLNELLPWAFDAARKVKRPLHLVYVEKWLDRPLDELRHECGITLPPPSLQRYTSY